ncbi:RNA polymerase sigma-70 factor [Parabacteroides sp. AM58-2XD]|uniref:RNA polymerase sigma-70 factor n=1 Tax=Parabacteroides TaxID=375288 RepID=UPI000FE1BC18|nr:MULTISPECIES: RNA polymerase sigma-70 factor [Parabacteroides]MCM0717153.1 RNA polymerase sigma-70 factor [Parabacteroides sp. W1-Q-101]RGY95000.1 RNA polymerase sigma-70 factor [Parabacteroides sp. AM58-2XD]GKG72392.1 DNA-directed RNA polymerase sigma-70 factor [Parabacteroides goldsteinii]GKG78510.1 DNA-directed RNA polymerase sigma-70 factor [Parabacteroides goldsteinii]
MKIKAFPEQEKRIRFEDVYLSYFSKMKYFAKEYVISEEDAENIVQDVFVELWENKEMLNMHMNLIAYLFTTIKNKCLNHLRHKLVVQETANKLQEEYTISLRMNLDSLEVFDNNLFSDHDIEKIISRALDALPEKCRAIFIMSKIEGKKHNEIAQELNISINTVGSQIGIAYKKLRTELKDYLPILLFLLSL